jgi:terminase large subunit-like protein
MAKRAAQTAVAEPEEIRYKASRVLTQFHQSQKFYRLVLGPVGSGKSTACCFEILMKGQQQEPFRGVRKTRFVVVRNTYRELKDTTIQTWLQWFPEERFGKFLWTDMIHRVDLGEVQIEVLFRALDTVEDIKKLLSLDVTGAWINEAREVPKGIVDALAERCGRYPSKSQGGPSWKGIFMDSNKPDEDHWIYDIAENRLAELKEWGVFKQPGGLIEKDGKFVENPLAENLENLPNGYYLQGLETADPDHVRVMRCAQYGYVREGKAVIHEYSDQVHCAKEKLQPVGGVPIRIGLDFGLTPAALFAQKLADGRWIWFDEVVSEDMGITRFCIPLINKIQSYAKHSFAPLYGDPAGNARMQTDEQTVFQVINAQLSNARLPLYSLGAPSNDFMLRREAIGKACQRMIDGKPGFLISPDVKVARKGLRGAYCFKRMKVVGDERYHDVPDKNTYSHVIEAGGYGMMGAGEGVSLITADAPQRAVEMPYMGCV